MSKEKKAAETEEVKQEQAEETKAAAEMTEEAAQEEKQPDAAPEVSELDQAKADLAAEKDKYLRLLAEYDNFRKRSQKEKDELYTVIRSETVGKFLPVYDNLERALNQETADEAYKKGVEMTMTQLVGVME
ncbi:MAG: nucleotide exchange factor GrpE, partial [Clostridia bacterium]|nr:nucleotide exchange factor GrpE [Clostridia bacterium]